MIQSRPEVLYPNKDSYWRFGHRVFKDEKMPEILKENE